MHFSFSSNMQTWRPHNGHVDETAPVLQSKALFSQHDSDWLLDVPRNFRSRSLINFWMQTMLYILGKTRIKDDDSTWVVLVNYLVTGDASLHVSRLVSYSEIVLSDPLHGLHLIVHILSARSPLSLCSSPLRSSKWPLTAVCHRGPAASTVVHSCVVEIRDCMAPSSAMYLGMWRFDVSCRISWNSIFASSLAISRARMLKPWEAISHNLACVCRPCFNLKLRNVQSTTGWRCMCRSLPLLIGLFWPPHEQSMLATVACRRSRTAWVAAVEVLQEVSELSWPPASS